MSYGIDVYHGTGAISFGSVKAAGYGFVIVKATEGVDFEDANFVDNVKAAAKAGLDVGAYHFLRATSIDKQASDFLAAIKGVGNYAMLAIDVENPSPNNTEISDLGKEGIMSRIMTLYNAIRDAGYTCPVYVYASASWLRTLIDVVACREAGLKIWMAAYSNDTPDNADRSADCDMWQWCSDGKVPGVTGDTDCDVCYRGIGASAPAKPASAPIGTAVHADYRVRVGGVWLPEVRDLTDFAGRSNGSPITDVAVHVSAGYIKYRVHICGGHWLPYVAGYNVGDSSNGYAGNDSPIDAVEVYYTTPDCIRPVKCAKYRVAPGACNYYPWQYDDQTTGGQDGYAGSFGRKIGKLQLCIE